MTLLGSEITAQRINPDSADICDSKFWHGSDVYQFSETGNLLSMLGDGIWIRDSNVSLPRLVSKPNAGASTPVNFTVEGSNFRLGLDSTAWSQFMEPSLTVDSGSRGSVIGSFGQLRVSNNSRLEGQGLVLNQKVEINTLSSLLLRGEGTSVTNSADVTLRNSLLQVLEGASFTPNALDCAGWSAADLAENDQIIKPEGSNCRATDDITP